MNLMARRSKGEKNCQDSTLPSPINQTLNLVLLGDAAMCNKRVYGEASLWDAWQEARGEKL
jgi:hypothetical protein